MKDLLVSQRLPNCQCPHLLDWHDLPWWIYSEGTLLRTICLGLFVAIFLIFLQDSEGNELYMGWGCNPGSECPRRACNLAQLNVRKHLLDLVENQIQNGNYRGIYFEDISYNLDSIIVDGNGDPKVPVDTWVASPSGDTFYSPICQESQKLMTNQHSSPKGEMAIN